MTATASSPQVMRDRLLQAIDGQSNICNTVMVVEVFSLLEKYPITREVLEETRLGKLVNDVRRKTKNPDVAKRAKKLLLTWQKFIEPERADAGTNGVSCVSSPPPTPPVSKVGSELKDRSDFNNCSSAVGKNHSNRNHQESPPTKKSKKSLSGKDNRSEVRVTWNNGLDIERQSQIPVNAIIPHPSAHEQTSLEEVVSRTHCRPPSPQQTSGDPDRPSLGPPFLSMHDSDRKLADSSYDNKHPGLSLQAVYSKGPRGRKSKRKRKDQVSESNPDGKHCDSKTTKFKDRGLKFNPVTGQIKPSEGLRQDTPPWPRTTEHPNPSAPTSYDPLKQAVYKELSHNEIIQSYLRQQSSLLSSGSQAAGSPATDHQSASATERHELVSEPPARDFPGVSREVRSQDTDRLHTQHWSGVNGCYDNKGNWYDWTECISLDLRGDESRLNILPYVCLD
ncbi:mediator of RNA polymerase II transcription subunit 26-like [Neosynchiropus ocellatus]